MERNTPYFLTDATLEQKKAYYEDMENKYKEKRRKTHKTETIKMFLFWGVTVGCGLVSYAIRDTWLINKVLICTLMIMSAVLLMTTAYSMVMDSKCPIPVELVFWWDYLEHIDDEGTINE